jgi:NAD(P)-dependent dehydrogenase (short-subunit alcohol dehydrogenase family)
MRLKGKNMIVTGGASGIGLATVRGALREGANVALSDLPQSEGAALARELDGKNGQGRCLFIVFTNEINPAPRMR